MNRRHTPLPASTAAPDHTRQDQCLPHVIIRASAGTGKTFQLSNRYLQLVLTGLGPERILATTFTRKAAGEILDRILLRLAVAAEGRESAERLAQELGLPALSLPDCRRALRIVTRNLHRLRIATLDSFFLQATQSLSLELGLPPRWQILEESDELELREQAIAAMVSSGEPSTVLKLLHWLAKGATHRGVQRLLNDTVANMYSLYLESPADAWHRLPRIAGLKGEDLVQLQAELETWSAEFNGDARLRKAVVALLGQLQGEAWEDIAGKGLGRKLIDGDPTYYNKPVPTDLLQMVQRMVEHARAMLQNRYALQTEASYELLDRFHQEFETRKLQRRGLRFHDLARYLGQIEATSHLSQLSFRLDTSIDALLLDEFQDTSLDQWRVIRPFARHATAATPRRSFLCVGDLKQAIYGWRGGNAELMDAVATELSELSDLSLDRSFRSASVVIDAVNQINIKMDQHDNLEQCRTAVEMWIKRFPHHTTSRTELPGYVSLETTDWAGVVEEQRSRAIVAAADRVEWLRSQSPRLEIAVLVRTNQSVGRVMFELQRRGILASEEGGNPLTNSAAVQLVLSRLTLSDHPQDSAARFHLTHSPWGAMLGLKSHCDDAAVERLSVLDRLVLADDGYGNVVNAWIEQLKPFTNSREWRRLNQLVEMAYRYQNLIESPRDVGYHRQHVRPIATAEFIARVTQQRVSDPTEDPVRVMTIHQSKGLQFDVVILPDLERKLDPHAPSYAVDRPRATDPIETIVRWIPKNVRELMPQHIQQVHDHDLTRQVQEELSVLYVALTRAVHALHLIIAPSQQAAGGASPRDKAEAKKMPRTIAGLVRAALTDGLPLVPCQTVWECGDREWWRGTTPHVAASKRDRTITLPRVALRETRNTQHRPTDKVVRPSMLEGGGCVRLADRLSLSGQLAMQRGSLIHAFFEQIEWLETGVPDHDTLRAVGLSMDVDLEYLEHGITQFHDIIARASIQNALARRRYQPWYDALSSSECTSPQLDVRREQRLLAHDGGDWLSGSIDRLVLLRREGQPLAAEILDFKTDAISSIESRQRLVEFYQPQLLAYRRGVSHMLRLPESKIATTLMFLADGHLESITYVN